MIERFPTTARIQARITETNSKIAELGSRIAASRERLADMMAQEAPNDTEAEKLQRGIEGLIRERERLELQAAALAERLPNAQVEDARALATSILGKYARAVGRDHDKSVSLFLDAIATASQHLEKAMAARRQLNAALDGIRLLTEELGISDPLDGFTFAQLDDRFDRLASRLQEWPAQGHEGEHADTLGAIRDVVASRKRRAPKAEAEAAPRPMIVNHLLDPDRIAADRERREREERERRDAANANLAHRIITFS